MPQQLREATPFGQHPRHLIRDNDAKFGPAFRALATATGIKDVRTAYRAARENDCCERLVGSVCRECLDHLLILNEMHVLRVLTEYVHYYNSARQHHGLHQRIPDPLVSSANPTGTVCAMPVLGGLYRSYARAAQQHVDTLSSQSSHNSRVNRECCVPCASARLLPRGRTAPAQR